MPAERYAKWDTLKLPYGFNEAYIESPNTVEGERAKRRVAPYEEYVALVEEGEAGERRELARASLVRETKRRVARWLKTGAVMEGVPNTFGGEAVRATVRVLGVIGLVVVAWVFLLYLPTLAVRGVNWLMALFVVGVIALVTYGVMRFGGKQTRMAVCAGERKCLDCGYQLGETRPAIAESELDGMWVGPRTCPECGAPWPMVPPPAFDG